MSNLTLFRFHHHPHLPLGEVPSGALLLLTGTAAFEQIKVKNEYESVLEIKVYNQVSCDLHINSSYYF